MNNLSLKKELSILIPAYVEGENLRIILPKINSILQKLVDTYEIIVIDTVQVMDDTPLVCKNNNAHYYNEPRSDSYGNAIRTGIEKINSNYTIIMDADGSCNPEYIPILYSHRMEYDVVVGSRYISGGKTNNTRFAIVLSRILNTLFSLVLGIRCKDISISFKLYKTDDLKQLVLTCDHFDIIEEILYKLKKNKSDLKIKEIPITFTKRIFGKSKQKLLTFIISYLKTIIKLRFGW